jgi:hypothetical protein
VGDQSVLAKARLAGKREPSVDPDSLNSRERTIVLEAHPRPNDWVPVWSLTWVAEAEEGMELDPYPAIIDRNEDGFPLDPVHVTP